MDKKTYLFTLTISPVQSFIAQARKSQDLFAGSEILSQLMGKVLETFTDKERIFPRKKEAVSNKILAKLENKTEEDIKKIGEDLEEKINKEFINTVFKETKCYDNSLQNFFQVYWVAVVLDDDYQKRYKQLERNLGAVKNLRTFKQEPPQESGQKCSLCGERNGLFYNNDKLPRYIIKNAIRIKDAQIKENETLCAVCFTKRNYKKDGSFPSLAKICLLDWLKDVNYDELKKLPDFDEEWFLEEPKKAEVAQFIKDNKLDTSTQKKHYALLHFDVDSLGKTLSGLPEKGQKDLSKKLGEFALKAKAIVDKDGRTVYAGGDDFLGFVNLAYLFDVIESIYSKFGETKASLPYELTFSTSIVIAHYKAPLHKVLDYSRELLEESKNHFEDKKKNGVGIMVMSSNAIISKTICRYEDIGLLKELKTAEIAKNLHFKLAQIFDYLGEMSYDEFLTQKAMIEVEIKRLLNREKSNFEKDEELKELYEKLIGFLNKQTKKLSTNRYQIDFENFIGFLKTLEQL